MKLSPKAEEIVRRGSRKIRVTRSGMGQQVTFRIRQQAFGSLTHIELYTDKSIERTELVKIAYETGLPVAASNGRAFPEGKGVTDFAVS